MKKIFAVIFAVVFILSCSVTVSAVENLKSDNCIAVTYDGKTEITNVDFSKIKKSIDLISLSDTQKVTYIFDKIGIEYVERSGMFNELVADFDYLGDIITTTSYYEIDDSTGNAIQLTKAECELKAAVAKSANVSTDLSVQSTVSGSTESDNGYMSISTSLIPKTNEATGTYNVMASCTWLKFPATRDIDAISIASNQMTWVARDNSAYSAIIIAEKTVGSGYYTEEKTAPDYVYLNGFYYSFNMPNSLYTNINILVSGKGRITNYNNPNQQVSVSTKYAHVQIEKIISNPSFSWSFSGDIGVSISGGSLKEAYYYNYVEWDYADHYYDY